MARMAARKLGFRQIAMVVGRTIYLHGVTRAQFLTRPSWVLHELAHVAQYDRYGLLLFLVRYCIGHLRAGYDQNPLEQEARARERDTSLLMHYKIKGLADS